MGLRAAVSGVARESELRDMQMGMEVRNLLGSIWLWRAWMEM